MSDAIPKKNKTTYEDILKLPDNVLGEIVNGELFVSPRPSGPNIYAASSLCAELDPPFSKGKGGGPGGWWVLVEPEIEFQKDTQHFVPDLAGWRKERMPKLPEKNVFTVTPDWVCEVLSPSNMRLDKTEKAPKYATFGVRYLWFINPRDKTLDVFRLETGKWVLLSSYTEADKVKAEPFQEWEFDLGNLWE